MCCLQLGSLPITWSGWVQWPLLPAVLAHNRSSCVQRGYAFLSDVQYARGVE
ncbi:hypothetical protein LINPERHAP1_LOCUS32913 [Linum perenne]